jgi:hypothetical protein
MRRREFISAAALLPLAARAQPSSKVYRLGYLALARVPHLIEALQAGLRELGYVEGKNLIVESQLQNSLGVGVQRTRGECGHGILQVCVRSDGRMAGEWASF